MSGIGGTAAFAAGLYWRRASVGYAGHVRRDPLALLNLRRGQAYPYPIYERIRATGALVPTRLGWMSVSHRVCDSVLRNRRFGVRLEEDETRELDLSFLQKNPPDHTRLRRLALPSFSPKAVAGYRDRIQSTTGHLLDRAAAKGEFDLVSALAGPLPIAVITDLLGIPDADAEAFARDGIVLGSALDGIKSLRHASQLQANSLKLQRLFDRLFELRRREPANDVISRLLAAEGDQLTSAEILSMSMLLLIAGFETTVNLIGNCVLALLDHREQWQDLCADPQALASKAVEETLRYDSPVQVTSRVALEPQDLEGQVVHRGQHVVTLIGGANRDPEIYAEPGTFNIHREAAAEHLSFSSGIHYCLGQALARLEATIALQMLAERIPGLGLAGPIQRRRTTTLRGPLHLPVTTCRTTSGPAVACACRATAQLVGMSLIRRGHHGAASLAQLLLSPGSSRRTTCAMASPQLVGPLRGTDVPRSTTPRTPHSR